MKNIIFFILLPFLSLAQNDFSGGLLPRVNASFKLNDRFKINSSLELRQQLFDQKFENDRDADFILADLANTLSYKLSSNQSLNFGYTVRSRGEEFHHRFTQQFSWVQQKTFFRLGHRLVTDQTFFPNEKGEYRLRYRVSLEKPLKGSVVDDKEFYLKLNNEYLGILSEGAGEFEFRMIPFLGYEIKRNQKVEFGLDYRLSGFAESSRNQRLWLSMIYYVSF